jgi:hypothetical protein
MTDNLATLERKLYNQRDEMATLLRAIDYILSCAIDAKDALDTNHLDVTRERLVSIIQRVKEI